MKARILAAAAAVTLMASGHAMAAGLTPGLYSVSGLQTICLVKGGTWYGVSYSPWSGYFKLVSGTTYIYGRYASGSDDIAIKNGKGAWIEFTDDLAYRYVQPATLVKQSVSCAAASHAPAQNKGAPTQR